MLRARSLVLALVVLCVACVPTTAQTLLLAEKDQLKTVTLTVNGVDVPIYYGGPVYHLVTTLEIRRQYPLYLGLQDNLKNQFVQIGGKAFRVHFESSAPEVASIDEYGFITFHSPGSATFTVRIGDQEAHVDVQVLEGPWALGMFTRVPVEEVVERLGFPDRRTDMYLTWPQLSGRLDGIWYSFSGTGPISVVHWHYDEYPNLVFRVQSNREVIKIHNLGWDCGYATTVRTRLGL